MTDTNTIPIDLDDGMAHHAKTVGRIDVDAMWEMRSDGRTVRGRIIPFNEVADVFERGQRIKEQFLPGCVERLCQVIAKTGNARWIGFNFDHDESLDKHIGHVAAMEQRSDGAWADFRIVESRDIDKVRSMLKESHTGLSVMFSDVVPPRTLNGIRSRVQVNIEHVAATPWAAYAGAAIASIRSGDDPLALDDRPALAEWQAYLDSIKR